MVMPLIRSNKPSSIYTLKLTLMTKARDFIKPGEKILAIFTKGMHFELVASIPRIGCTNALTRLSWHRVSSTILSARGSLALPYPLHSRRRYYDRDNESGTAHVTRYSQ
jgi:hypothetical protein